MNEVCREQVKPNSGAQIQMQLTCKITKCTFSNLNSSYSRKMAVKESYPRLLLRQRISTAKITLVNGASYLC